MSDIMCKFNSNRIILEDISSVIFDLDGTLFDSMGVWQEVDIAFLKKRGYSVPSFYSEKICTLTPREAAEYTAKLFNLKDSVEKIIDEWNEMALYEYSNNVKLKPLAAEYLDELHSNGIPMFVATALSQKLCEPALKNNGIYDIFSRICTVDEVLKGKEHPDIFFNAIEAAGSNPKECVIFEDLLPAIKAAKQTDAFVCGIYDDYSKKHVSEIKNNSDLFIESFSDAPIIVRKKN